MARGTGETTKALIASPIGAYYVWCNGHLDYPKDLLRKINRPDIVIIRPEILDDHHRLRGLQFSALILDHACRLTDRQWDSYKEFVKRIHP